MNVHNLITAPNATLLNMTMHYSLSEVSNRCLNCSRCREKMSLWCVWFKVNNFYWQWNVILWASINKINCCVQKYNVSKPFDVCFYRRLEQKEGPIFHCHIRRRVTGDDENVTLFRWRQSCLLFWIDLHSSYVPKVLYELYWCLPEFELRIWGIFIYLFYC